MNDLYSVKVTATGRYIIHCDDCWYETSAAEMRIYSKERAEEIAKQMRHHYVYKVTISNGEETYEVSAFQNPMAKKPVAPKSIAKFNLNRKF